MQIQSPHEEFALIGGNPQAVVFVHGFGGSPENFRQMAEFLFQAGYDCRALLLPGHGSDGSAFCRTPYGAWKAHIHQAIEDTARQYDRIFLAGHSLGGLLCLDYASGHAVSGLVLINTPLAVKLSPKQLWINYRVLFSSPDKDDELLSVYRKGTGIGGGCKWYEYPLMLGQLINLLRYKRSTKRLLGDVKAHTLIVQSGKDEEVRQKSVRLLLKGLVHAPVEELRLANSYHSFHPKAEQQLLQESVLQFIRKF